RQPVRPVVGVGGGAVPLRGSGVPVRVGHRGQVAVQVVRVGRDRCATSRVRPRDLDQTAGVVVGVGGLMVVVVLAGLQVAVAVVGVGREPAVGGLDGENAPGRVVRVAGLVVVRVLREVDVADRVVV